MQSQVNQNHIQAMESVFDQVTAWMTGTIEDIKIKKNNQTVYDSKSNDPEKRQVTPQLIQDIATLKQTPADEQIEGNTDSIEINVNTQVTLSSRQGKVTTNLYQQPEPEASTIEQNPILEQDSDSLSDYSDDRETAWKNTVLAEDLENNNLDFPPTLESPSPTPGSNPTPQDQKTGGLQIVQNAVERLENSPLKQLLTDTITEIKQLQDQQTQRLQKQSDKQTHPDTALQQLAARQSDSSPQWWQKIAAQSNNFQEKLAQKDAAATLHQLFHAQVPPPGKNYQAAEYNINRTGNTYTLSDKQGNTLLSFDKKAMGIQVNASNLTVDHTEQIAHAKQQMKAGISPDGAFQSSATRDAKIFARTHAIAHALTR